MSLFTSIYYAGVVVCGILGAEKSIRQKQFFSHSLLTAFWMAFGGGIIRDIMLLQRIPVVLTFECLPDVIIAELSAGIYYVIHRDAPLNRTAKGLVGFFDASSLGTFISIGIEASLTSGFPPCLAWFSGVVTALGGGILTDFLCGTPIPKILKSNISYRVITIIGCIFYSYSRPYNNEKNIQIIVILYTLLVNTAYSQYIRRNTLKKTYCHPLLGILLSQLNTPHWASIIIILIKIHQNQKAFGSHIACQTAVLYSLKFWKNRSVLFHKLLQM